MRGGFKLSDLRRQSIARWTRREMAHFDLKPELSCRKVLCKRMWYRTHAFLHRKVLPLKEGRERDNVSQSPVEATSRAVMMELDSRFVRLSSHFTADLVSLVGVLFELRNEVILQSRIGQSSA